MKRYVVHVLPAEDLENYLSGQPVLIGQFGKLDQPIQRPPSQGYVAPGSATVLKSEVRLVNVYQEPRYVTDYDKERVYMHYRVVWEEETADGIP